LRVAVSRMATTGLTRFPVVERDNSRKVVGMVSLNDLLKARAHNLEAEQRRERILPLRIAFPRSRPRPQQVDSESEAEAEVATDPSNESPTEAVTEATTEPAGGSTSEPEADKTTSQT